MKKILITTAGNSLNKGEMAMVLSTTSILKKNVPNISFTILSKRFAVDRENYKKYNLNVIEQHWIKKNNSNLKTLLFAGLETSRTLSYGILWRLLNNFKFDLKSPYINVFRQHDMIIELSGDCFTDGYGVIPYFYYLFPLVMGILLKKDVIIYAQSIGPFESNIMKHIGKIILNRCKLVTIREDITKNYLEKIGYNKFVSTADSAFLLDPMPLKKIDGVILHDSKPLIGICISESLSRYSKLNGSKTEYNTHIDVMVKVIDYLTEQLDANVLLIPHVYDTVGGHDDRAIEHTCYTKSKNKNRIKLIEEEYSPDILKEIISHCDLFIGSRMHSTIAAVSTYVPTIAIAYSHKTHGIIGTLLEQEEYVIDVKDMEYNNIVSKIHSAWKDRKMIKKKLEIKIPVIKEKSALNGKLVKEILCS